MVNLVSVYYEYQQRAEVETRETKVEKGYKILGMGSLFYCIWGSSETVVGYTVYTHKLPLVLSVNLCCNTDITPSENNSIQFTDGWTDQIGWGFQPLVGFSLL